MCGSASAKEERCLGGAKFSIPLLALFCATCYIFSVCILPHFNSYSYIFLLLPLALLS
jgi:hypothetical protein